MSLGRSQVAPQAEREPVATSQVDPQLQAAPHPAPGLEPEASGQRPEVGGGAGPREDLPLGVCAEVRAAGTAKARVGTALEKVEAGWSQPVRWAQSRGHNLSPALGWEPEVFWASEPRPQAEPSAESDPVPCDWWGLVIDLRRKR